ncbi:glycosyl hydrolase family 16 [Prevotella sp. DNF00663]|uniref:glycoside hydrolase family 16 protein n=1 Tax=unclassified Prevotella TaxID=2638335 RepID=UPI0006915EF3|nr:MULTISPECIES: glycoside hydrolase family 16 protein [unclassified Prevotella]KXB83975.1 glycosyl hydrolase family 16 [Prevotella sp. DNF00663]
MKTMIQSIQTLTLTSILLLGSMSLQACTKAAIVPEEKGQKGDKTLFVENFDGVSKRPDPAVWMLCKYSDTVWGRYFEHAQNYENVRVEGGYLKLKADKRDGIYRNGGIRTIKGFPCNTRVEVKARFTHQVKGGFPAIWQMPIKGKNWPQSGEIDIMEWIQSTPGEIYQTVHTSYNREHLGRTGATNTQPNRNLDITKDHVYAVERTEKALIFYLDGCETWRYENRQTTDEKGNIQYPFADYDFDIILNFSLGGKFKGEETWPGDIDDADLPGEMWIDWVKVSKL